MNQSRYIVWKLTTDNGQKYSHSHHYLIITNKMKIIKYHTVETFLKYHTIETFLKYHTVETFLNIKYL
jgi:hypothetical protein